MLTQVALITADSFKCLQGKVRIMNSQKKCKCAFKDSFVCSPGCMHVIQWQLSTNLEDPSLSGLIYITRATTARRRIGSATHSINFVISLNSRCPPASSRSRSSRSATRFTARTNPLLGRFTCLRKEQSQPQARQC